MSQENNANTEGYFLNRSNYLNELNEAFSKAGLPSLDFIPVADDDGYNQNNIAFWAVEDGKLSIKEHRIVSRGKRGRHVSTVGGGSVDIYQSGDEEYTISENINEAEDTRTPDYAKTPLNRFLVHAALNSIGLTNGVDVSVITGLPVGQHTKKGGEVNKKLIRAKTKNILKPVTLGINKTPSANIVYHGVLPEAICGLVDWIMDDNGNVVRDANVMRMVMDIGGNTTDMAVILPGNKVAEVKTAPFGVSHMSDNLRTMMEDKLDIQLDSMLLDSALKTKKAVVFGEPHDVSAEWEKSVSSVLNDIFREADALRKKYPSIVEMVGFGGGMALCQDLVAEKYKHIRVVDRPDGANARGALKFSTFNLLDQMIELKGKQLNEDTLEV
jgi:plasmid segregation protein ParM